MKQVDSSVSSRRRFESVFDDLIEDLKAFIRRHELSYEEYHRAVEFVAQAGTAGEVPLLMDVFLEAVVDEVNYGGRPGTESSLEGPYYIPGTPLLKPPYVLPQREDEDGEILFFSGHRSLHTGSSPRGGSAGSLAGGRIRHVFAV